MHKRGRQHDRCTERNWKRSRRREPESDGTSERKENAGNGGMKQEEGRVEGKRGCLAQVQGCPRQNWCHLPAASLGQQHSACAAPTSSMLVSVSEPVCTRMDAAELRHSTGIRCITCQTAGGGSLQSTSPVTVAPPSASRPLSQPLNSSGKPLKNISLSLLLLADDA